MNQHIPDREPDRRPLPGPFTEAGVLDELQRYAADRAYFEERYGKAPELRPHFDVADEYSDSASSAAMRRDRDQEAGIV